RIIKKKRTYLVRVRAGNAQLLLTAWSTPLSFTVDDPTPAAPELTAPAGTVSTGLPEFVWTAVAGARSYELRITRTGQPDVVVAESSTSVTLSTPLSGGEYSAAVRAVNSEGEVSDWSSPAALTVDIGVPAAPVLFPPDSPLTDSSPTLIWSVPDFAWTFEVQISRHDGSSTAVVVDQTDLRILTDFGPARWSPGVVLPSGEYSYRVRAFNSDGVDGPWSTESAFTVSLPAAPPAVPQVITVPAADSTTSLLFEWTKAAFATSYELQVLRKTPTPEEVVVTAEAITGHQATIVQDLPAGTFEVRVRAVNDVGASMWSTPAEFTLATGTTIVLPGNVDGDGDFDANDSFLIHLVQLSGTDSQISLLKGESALTAEQIRAVVTQLESGAGDADGDGDFDANDSFLIHVVKLSGTDTHIELLKGGSSLSAAQIRLRINQLGTPNGAAAAVQFPVTAAELAVEPPGEFGAASPEQSDLEQSDLEQSDLEQSDLMVTERDLLPVTPGLQGKTQAAGMPDPHADNSDYAGQVVPELPWFVRFSAGRVRSLRLRFRRTVDYDHPADGR
ncbi:MAG: hypothetical protein KDA89_00360, partial [Planctomycetaceae bacterium]|nr:hypothetical protein [Planctomycetaceae bacterium]